MQNECIECLYKQAERIFDKCNLASDRREDINTSFGLFIEMYKHNDLPTPELTRYLYHLVTEATRVSDVYKKEKEQYNDLLLSLEEELRMIIRQSENPFLTALKYALAGNVIDFAPNQHFDIFKTLTDTMKKEIAIDHSGILYDKLKEATTVLYLGDNAGEIVTDKLFIETINHKNLYFAVRGGYIINDATVFDATYVGMNQVARIVSNGYDAPSTIPSKCSKTFQEVYNKSDLIVSKGQGNLEGLLNERDKNIFFLLTVKCDVMARLIGAKNNDMVVFYNQS